MRCYMAIVTNGGRKGRPYKYIGALKYIEGYGFCRRIGYVSEDIKAGEPIDIPLKEATILIQEMAYQQKKDMKKRIYRKIGLFFDKKAQ